MEKSHTTHALIDEVSSEQRRSFNYIIEDCSSVESVNQQPEIEVTVSQPLIPNPTPHHSLASESENIFPEIEPVKLRKAATRDNTSLKRKSVELGSKTAAKRSSTVFEDLQEIPTTPPIPVNQSSSFDEQSQEMFPQNESQTSQEDIINQSPQVVNMRKSKGRRGPLKRRSLIERSSAVFDAPIPNPVPHWLESDSEQDIKKTQQNCEQELSQNMFIDSAVRSEDSEISLGLQAVKMRKSKGRSGPLKRKSLIEQEITPKRNSLISVAHSDNEPVAQTVSSTVSIWSESDTEPLSRIVPLPNEYPASVDPKDYRKYQQCRQDPQYFRAPLSIPEPVHRRIPIPTNHFPGPTTVNGREEFYVESIYEELQYIDMRNERAFVVIWAGWPTTYASIEPETHLCNCVALDLFEAAKNGFLVGTGTHKSVRCTAVRSTKRQTSLLFVPNENCKKWPVDELDEIFDKRIKDGTYKKSIGFLDPNHKRKIMFDIEFKLWREVHQLITCKPSTNHYLSPTFYGNYFGHAKRHSEIKVIDSSQLETSWTVITKTISGRLNAMTSTKDKFCILFFVSQVGDFNANMNEPAVKGEGFKTHSCVLVARERSVEGKKKAERDYFWYEPTYHSPTDLYKPMKFLLNGSLSHKNLVNVIYGDQVDSHDCYYRCIRWIANVIEGNVVFDGPFQKQYDFNKRLGPQ